MKKRKIWRNISLFMTIAATTAISFNYLFNNELIPHNHNQNKLPSDNDVISNNISLANDTQNYATLNPPSNLTINDDNSVKFPNNKELATVSPNAFTSFPGGIFLAASDGCFALDENTLELKWELKNKDGSVNKQIGGSGNRVFYSLYMPKYDRLLVLHQQNGKLVLQLVNPNDGRILDTTKELEWSRNTSSDFSAIISPQVSWGNGGVMEITDCVNIVPRGEMTESQRKIHRVWFNGDSFRSTIETFSLRTPNQDKNVLLNIGHYWSPKLGNFYAFMKWRVSNGDIWFELDSQKSDLSWENKWSWNIGNFPYQNVGVDKAPHFVANLSMDYRTDDMKISGIVNAGGDSNFGHNTVVFGMSGDPTGKSYKTKKESLDVPGKRDYDIRYGRYDYSLKKFTVFSNHTNEERTAAMTIDTDNLDFNDTNDQLNPDSKLIKIWRSPSNDIIGSDRSKTWIPIFTKQKNIDDTNIFMVINRGSSIDRFVVYRGNSSGVNVDARYAYQTTWDGTKITLNGMENKNLYSENETYWNNILSGQSNEILKLFKMRKPNSTLSFRILGKPQPTNNKLPNEFIYKGVIPVDYTITNAFDNNGSPLDSFNINAYSDGRTDMYVHGFYKWVTELKKSTIPANDLSQYSSITKLKEFIFNKRDEIFKDIPIDFTKDNIISIKVGEVNNNQVNALIQINRWIDDNNILQTSNKFFTITLTNLKVVTAKNRITGELFDKTPSEIVYRIDELAPNGNVLDQNITVRFLSDLFDNLDLDLAVGNYYQISKLKAYADSLNGTLKVQFDLIQPNSYVAIIKGDFDINNGLKKGITSIDKHIYNDQANNFATIKSKLENSTQAKEYLTSNNVGILSNLSNLSNITVNFRADDINKMIIINEINVEKAIGITNLETINFTNQIVIIPSDYVGQPHQSTIIEISYDYLTHDDFKGVSTAQQFANYLNGKKEDKGTINLISKLVNASTEQNKETTIKIKSANIISDQKVDVVFEINNYYDHLGVLQSNPKEVTISYSAFPVHLVTNVVTENALEIANKDYAYQYTSGDIKQIIDNDIALGNNSKIVKNPVNNSSATINNFEINNRSGMINVSLTLSKAYDQTGAEKDNVIFNNIKFKAKNTITNSTNIQRNHNEVAETIRDVDAMDDNARKVWAKKYVEIINPVPTAPNTELLIDSVQKSPTTNYSSSNIETSGQYKVVARLKNYIENDDKFTYNASESAPKFITYINVKMNHTTVLLDTVKQNGIAADTIISHFPARDLLLPALNNNIDVLKQWIVNKTNANEIFEYYKTNMDVNSIENLTTEEVNGDDNAIKVNLTLSDAYQFDGTTASVQFTFIIHGLADNVWTKENKQIEIIGPNDKFASTYAKENNNQYVDLITKEIKDKNGTADEYFDRLPALDANDVIVQVHTIVDDANGEIIIMYKLPKFYVQGSIQTPANDNPNALIYQAIIKGFKTEVNNPFATMNKDIDANGAQLNTSINKNGANFDKVDAFNYKNAIKDSINNFLNSTTSMPEDMLNKIKMEMADFDNNAQFSELMIATRAISNVTAKVKVVYPQLAQLSNDENWNNGYVFSINNATYANTDVIVAKYENENMSITDFKKIASNTDKLVALNTSLNFASTEIFDANNYNDPTKLEITLQSEDPITGKVIVVFKFKEFFINNQAVKDYEMSFNFKFKSNTDSTSVNFIKDSEIAGTDLEADWGTNNGKTVSQIYAEIKVGTINIQDIINNKKDVILNANILTQYPNLVLTYKDVAFLNNNNDVYLSIDIGIKEDANDQKEVIEQLTVGKFSFKMAMTNPTAAIVPNDVTFDSIANVGSGNDITNGTAKGRFINYNDGKTPDANSDITITSAKLDIAKKTSSYQIAFVDFTFNGIYTAADDIRSFVSDYVVKLKMEFNQNGTLIKTHIVWSGGQDQYISADRVSSFSNNNNWIIYSIISLLVLLLAISYLTKTLYVKNKKKLTKVKKK